MEDSLQMFLDQHRRVRYFISEIAQLLRHPPSQELLPRLDVLWRGLSGLLVGHMILERKWLFPLLLEQGKHPGLKKITKVQDSSEKLQEAILNFRVQWSRQEGSATKARPLVEESRRLLSSIEEQLEEEDHLFRHRKAHKSVLAMLSSDR